MLAVERTALKVKLETTKGTKVSGDVAVFAEDLKLNPDAGFVPMNGTGVVIGNTQPGIYPSRTGTCSCKLPLRGDGSQAMDAGLAAFLQASAFKTADSKTFTLAPGFSDMSCLSVDEYDDGILKTLFGAMFNLKLEGEVGAPVWCNFDGKGKYDDESKATFPAFAPSARAAMTLEAATLTFDSFAFQISKFSLDIKSSVILVPDSTKSGGFIHAIITNTDPQIEMDPADELSDAYNFYAKLIARATTIAALPDLTLALSDGTDKITITLNAVQPMEIGNEQRDGLRSRKYVGRCHGDASTPAVTIAVAAP